MRRRLALLLVLVGFAAAADAETPKPRFHVLAFYSEQTEADHVDFAHQALEFFKADAERDHFDWQATTNWDDLNARNLQRFQIVVWLNDAPHTGAQRAAFEHYMDHGGAWLGFHAAAYNDRDTHWPWFVQFLGGAVFYSNNWPPLPAQLDVEQREHPVVRGLPPTYAAPANEWYIWKPDPRADRDVRVLLSLNRSNYPLGLKDTLTAGDLPVVWTNTRYRMVYCNMGHGDKIFTSATQNQLFRNAIMWLAEAQRKHRHR